MEARQSSTAMFGDSFSLYRNQWRWPFLDRCHKRRGLTAFTSRFTAWGTGLFDFDNDGNKDIFTADAEILDNVMKSTIGPLLFPMGCFATREISLLRSEFKSGKSVSVPAAHRGAAFGDFNNDGKIDIVVTVLKRLTELLMNRSETTITGYC